MSRALLLCCAVLFVGLLCEPAIAQNAQRYYVINSFDIQLLPDSAEFIISFNDSLNISDSTPCFMNKLILASGRNSSAPPTMGYNPRFPGTCTQSSRSSRNVTASLDPRDFISALGSGIFARNAMTYIRTVNGMEMNFLPSVDVAPLQTPLLARQQRASVEAPSMLGFDVDLNTNLLLMHFAGVMELSSLDMTVFTLRASQGRNFTLTATSRPIGVLANLVRTVCVTLSAEDVGRIQDLSICTARFGGCSGYFTSQLISDYNGREVEDVSPSNSLAASNVRVPSSGTPDVYMQVAVSYIGCNVTYNLTRDEVFNVQPQEYITRISCFGESPMITLDDSEEMIDQRYVRSGPTWTHLSFPGPNGLPEGNFGLYSCQAGSARIQSYIILNESPFIGLPEGLSYSARLYDPVTIPFFFRMSPHISLMDQSIEIIFSTTGSSPPDPMYRKLSPYKGEVYYAQAPNSINQTFTLTVMRTPSTGSAARVQQIRIRITPPSVRIVPSTLALLPSDTRVNLQCITNNRRLPVFWTMNSIRGATMSTSANYSTLVPSQGGFQNGVRFYCGVRDPDNVDVSPANVEASAAATVVNIQAPLSVYDMENNRVEDQAQIVRLNRFSGNVSLRCLGHAPSNVLGLVWISEQDGMPPMVLRPEDNNNYTIVEYSYNEAVLTINTLIQPYRGTLRCQSSSSGRQATFFVVERLIIGQQCRGGDVDPIWGIVWEETREGFRDSKRCPEINGVQTMGFASRRCLAGGNWDGRVDVSTCRNSQFQDLSDSAEDFFNMFSTLNMNLRNSMLNDLVVDLTNTTRPATQGFFPQDLNTTNNILWSIVTTITGNPQLAPVNLFDLFNNLLDSSNREGWTLLTSMSPGSRILLRSIEEFGEYLQRRAMGNSMNFSSENLYMQVRILSQSSRMEDVTYPEGEEFEQLGTQVTVPSSILTQQQSNGIINAIIRNLNDFLPQPSNENNSTTSILRIGSPLISTQILSAIPEIREFNDSIELTFRTNRLIRTYNPRCVFWNETEDIWDQRGVETVEVVRGEIGEYKTYDVRCEADHPDTFGVLMDQEIGIFDVGLVDYIGFGVIIFCAVMAMFAFLFSCCLDKLRKYSFSPYLTHMSLCCSLISGSVVFLAGIKLAVGNTGGCIATAALLQYFFTATFAWLFCESFIVVFFPWVSKNPISFILLFILGWGLPVIPTLITVGLLRDQYGSTFHCWFFFDGEFVVPIVMAEIIPKLALIAITLFLLLISCCTTCSRSCKLVENQSRLHIHMLRFMWFGIILLILLLVGSLAFALLHVNVYGLDYSLTGWVFMGLSIGFAIWLFLYSTIVSIMNQKVDYEMLWEIEAANKTIDRKKTKKTTGYQVAMPLTSFSPSTDFSDSVKKDDNEPSTFVVRKEEGNGTEAKE